MDIEIGEDMDCYITKPEVTRMKLCVVCCAIAHTYNFGAITCESCKAFFRRNAYRDDIMQRCQLQCVITRKTRSKCRSCRLKKCFERGMNKTLILSQEEKEKRNLKIGHNRVRKDVINLTRKNNYRSHKRSTDGGNNTATSEVVNPLSSFQEVFLKSLNKCYILEKEANSKQTHDINTASSNFAKETSEECIDLSSYDDAFDVNLIPVLNAEPSERNISNNQNESQVLQENIISSSAIVSNIHSDINDGHLEDKFHTQHNCNATSSHIIPLEVEKELCKGSKACFLNSQEANNDITGVVITIPDSNNVSPVHNPLTQSSGFTPSSEDDLEAILSNVSTDVDNNKIQKHNHLDDLDDILLSDTENLTKRKESSYTGVPTIVSIQPFNRLSSNTPSNCDEYVTTLEQSSGLLEQVMNDILCDSNIWDTSVSVPVQSNNGESSPVDMTKVWNDDTKHSDLVPQLSETLPDHFHGSVTIASNDDDSNYITCRATAINSDTEYSFKCTFEEPENQTIANDYQNSSVIAQEELDIQETSTILHELYLTLDNDKDDNVYSPNLDQIDDLFSIKVASSASSETSSLSESSNFSLNKENEDFRIDDFDDFLDQYFLSDSPNEMADSSELNKYECQTIIFSQGIQPHVIENMKPELGAIINELKSAFAESFDKPTPQEIKEPVEEVAMFNQFGIIIEQAVQFAKGIVAFRNLEQADQITLVKGSFVHLLGIRLLGDFNEQTNCFEVRHLKDGENVTVTKVRTLVIANHDIGKALTNKFFKFAKAFSNATKRDPGILMCLTGYALFSMRSKSTYINKDYIQHWCELYLKTLVNYIEVAYPDGEIKLSNILRAMEGTGKASSLFQKAFDKLDVNQLSPVLLELFSV